MNAGAASRGTLPGGLRLRRLIAACVASVALGGCVGMEGAQKRKPPFREAYYGAGMETDTPGRLLEVRSEDNQTLFARYRLSSGALRVFSDELLRLGQVRIAESGWRIERVDGSALGSLGIADDEATLHLGHTILELQKRGAAWVLFSQRNETARLQPLPGAEGWQLLENGQETARLVGETLQIRGDEWVVSPASLASAAVLFSAVELEGLQGNDLELIRGALLFALERLQED